MPSFKNYTLISKRNFSDELDINKSERRKATALAIGLGLTGEAINGFVRYAETFGERSKGQNIELTDDVKQIVGKYSGAQGSQKRWNANFIMEHIDKPEFAAAAKELVSVADSTTRSKNIIALADSVAGHSILATETRAGDAGFLKQFLSRHIYSQKTDFRNDFDHLRTLLGLLGADGQATACTSFAETIKELPKAQKLAFKNQTLTLLNDASQRERVVKDILDVGAFAYNPGTTASDLGQHELFVWLDEACKNNSDVRAAVIKDIKTRPAAIQGRIARNMQKNSDILSDLIKNQISPEEVQQATNQYQTERANHNKATTAVNDAQKKVSSTGKKVDKARTDLREHLETLVKNPQMPDQERNDLQRAIDLLANHADNNDDINARRILEQYQNLGNEYDKYNDALDKHNKALHNRQNAQETLRRNPEPHRPQNMTATAEDIATNLNVPPDYVKQVYNYGNSLEPSAFENLHANIKIDSVADLEAHLGGGLELDGVNLKNLKSYAIVENKTLLGKGDEVLQELVATAAHDNIMEMLAEGVQANKWTIDSNTGKIKLTGNNILPTGITLNTDGKITAIDLSNLCKTSEYKNAVQATAKNTNLHHPGITNCIQGLKTPQQISRPVLHFLNFIWQNVRAALSFLPRHIPKLKNISWIANGTRKGWKATDVTGLKNGTIINSSDIESATRSGTAAKHNVKWGKTVGIAAGIAGAATVGAVGYSLYKKTLSSQIKGACEKFKRVLYEPDLVHSEDIYKEGEDGAYFAGILQKSRERYIECMKAWFNGRGKTSIKGYRVTDCTVEVDKPKYFSIMVIGIEYRRGMVLRIAKVKYYFEADFHLTLQDTTSATEEKDFTWMDEYKDTFVFASSETLKPKEEYELLKSCEKDKDPILSKHNYEWKSINATLPSETFLSECITPVYNYRTDGEKLDEVPSYSTTKSVTVRNPVYKIGFPNNKNGWTDGTTGGGYFSSKAGPKPMFVCDMWFDKGNRV